MTTPDGHASLTAADQTSDCGVITSSTVTNQPYHSSSPRSFEGQIMYRANGSALLIFGDVVDSEMVSALSDAHDAAYEACDVTLTSGKNSNFNNNNLTFDSIPKIPGFLSFFDKSTVCANKGVVLNTMAKSFRVHTFNKNDDSVKSCDSNFEFNRILLKNKRENLYTQERIMMCFPCRLTFPDVMSFLYHVTSHHDVKINDRERKLSEDSEAGMVLQKSSLGRCFLCFLDKVKTNNNNTKNEGVEISMKTDGAFQTDKNSDSKVDSEPCASTNICKSPESRLNRENNCDITKIASDVAVRSDDAAALDLTNANLASNPTQKDMLFSGDVTSSLHLPTMLVSAPDRDALHSALAGISTKGFSPSCDVPQRQTLGSPNLTTNISPPPPTSSTENDVNNTSSSSKESRFIAENEHETRTPIFRTPDLQKSDTMLLNNNSSTVDSMFSMSLFQSRNSCKTLKCPKCNWHYKYRQTLEAHMKEKHMEDTTDCVYCNAGQAHPRLSRGESYSCGYKPFKCTVCNYSTTTKGNLSIHMQSDKHLYNARTMQHRQQECLRQAASSTFTPSRHQSNQPDLNTSLMDDVQMPSRSPSTEAYTSRDNTSKPRPKRRPSSSKSNGSVADGAQSASSGRKEQNSGGKWRCDVCGYETSIARNLRIHNTSEKHAQNVALMERGMIKKMRPNGEDYSVDQSESSNQLNSSQGLVDYYTNALKSLQQNHLSGDAGSRLATDDAEKARKLQADYLQQQLLISQQQQLLLAQQYQQLMVAAAAASTLQQRLAAGGDEAATEQAKQLQSAHMWKQLFPNVGAEDSDINANLQSGKPMTGNNSSKVTSLFMFSCDVCGVFGTDDLASLEAHTRKTRHSDVTNEQSLNNEWIMRTPRDGYFCRLCKYTTPLKTNFNLHCKTEKHTNKLNLIAHVREGGAATEWMITHVINGNITQSVACNTCHFVTHSLEKLKQHCASEQHQGVQTVCQFLHTHLKRRRGELLNKNAKGADLRLTLRCLACQDFKTEYIVEMVRHMQTSEHQVQLQRHNNPPMTTLHDVVGLEVEGEEAATNKDEETLMQKEHTCQYCNYVADSDERLNMHIMVQHSDQPPTQCPLCQEYFKDSMHLQVHLLQFHKISLPGRSITESDAKIDAVEKEVIRSESQENPKNDETVTKLNQRSSGHQAMDKVESHESDATVSTQEQESTCKLKVEPQFEKQMDFTVNPTSHETNRENQTVNRPLSPSTPSESLSRSCPNLAAIFQDSKAPDGAVELSGKEKEAKPKRSRIRSCPVVESSRSRACVDLLTNYGLEQAQHYVENRSPENRNKAKTFRAELEVKKAPECDSQVSDPTEVSEDPQRESFSSQKQEDSMEIATQQVEEEANENAGKSKDEEAILSCQYCGKDFTGLWILKAHEEVAHGVCVPTKNIQKTASAYSDKFRDKIRDHTTPDQENSGDASDTVTAQPTLPLGINGVSEEQAKDIQQQLVLKAIMNAQGGQWDGAQSGGYMDPPTGAVNPLYASDAMPGNMLSMNLYSALLQMQAQSLGLTPFQLLANAAAAQQIQQINLGRGAMGSLLRPQDAARTAPGALNYAPALSALPNQTLNQTSNFDGFAKKDTNRSSSSSSQPQQMEMPVKRPRTRITDDQLKVLRANFDINNSPSEEQIEQMATQTCLPPKVIKHWFRNTLFKERQRSKDSPYNFNIPPITSLEDAFKKSTSKEEPAYREKTETKMQDMADSSKMDVSFQRPSTLDANNNEKRNILNNDASRIATSAEILRRLAHSSSKATAGGGDFPDSLSLVTDMSQSQQRVEVKKEEQGIIQGQENKMQSQPPAYSFANFAADTKNDSYYYDSHVSDASNSSMTSQSGSCRRTPRTRFTDYQLQILQEFFDRNAYPKDDDLDRMSNALGLSTRVIVVWFQNARQKARKSLEQQQQMQGNVSHDGETQQATNGSPVPADGGAKSRVTSQLDAPTGVEDLARRALTEVSKTISRRLESPEENAEKRGKPNPEAMTLPCQYCEATFSSVETWKQHHQQHVSAVASMFSPYGVMYMQGMMGGNTAPAEENVMGNTDGKSSFAEPTFGKMLGAQSSSKEDKNSASNKRKMSISPTYSSSSSTSPYQSTQMGSFKAKGPFDNNEKESSGSQKDPKRLRTTITPEQLEFLYKQYLIDSSPSRKVIEQISEVVGLKKRVVQVWFQNTRARERKGQFRSSVARCVTGQMTQYKFCQLCRMVFRSKVELDAHLQMKHGQDEQSAGSPPEKKFKLETLNTGSNSEVLKKEGYTQLKRETSPEGSRMEIIKENNNFGNSSNASPKDPNNNVTATSTNHSHAFYDVIGQQGVDLQKKLAALYSSGSKEFPTPALFNYQPTSGATTLSGRTTASGKPLSGEPTSPKREVVVERPAVVTPQYEHATASTAMPFSRGTVPEVTFASVLKTTGGVPSTSPTHADSGILPPPKRFRTQMSSSQVRALKNCFKACKTPSLPECELIGSEVGLAKRVVQVWFQNSRAKEKKHKSIQPTSSIDEFLVKECEVCFPAVHFASPQHAREHIFSRPHLQQLVRHLEYEAASGCGISQSSPASSYDSSDAAILSEPAYSPPTQVRASSPTTSFTTDPQLSGHVTLTVSRVGERGSYQNGKEEGRLNSAPSEQSIEDSRLSRVENTATTNSTVPVNRSELFEQYQQAMQQFLANQQQEGTGERSDEERQKNLQQIQNALQQSVFQMFQMSQRSGAELADK